MTQPQANPQPTITVNGETFLLEELAPELQEMIAAYQTWEREAGEAREAVIKADAAVRAANLNVSKHDAALRGLGIEIKHRLEQHKASTKPVEPAEAKPVRTLKPVRKKAKPKS